MKFIVTRAQLAVPLLLCFFVLPGILEVFSPDLFGQAGQALPGIQESRIEGIRIVGNRRITESTIRYYIQSREEGVYDERQAFDDYRALLSTNFFEDAKLKRTEGETGVIIIFEVVERPLIRSIEYEGMKS